MRGLIVIGVATVALLVASAPAGAIVLVDQFPNGPATVPTVWSLDAPGSDSDSQAADDFSVPEGRSYTPQSIDVVGYAFAGNGQFNATVRIYADAGGPGAELFSQNVPSGVSCAFHTNCDFTAGVTGAPVLAPGTYWISVQSTGSVGWNWAVTPAGAPHGAAARWQNPANGSNRNCPTWRTLAECNWTTASDGTDLIYRLNGAVADSRFAFGDFSSKGKKLFLAATFPSAGALALKGKGLKPSTKSVPAGEQKVRLKLKKGVQRKLARGKKAKVRVDATFTATGGPPYTQTATVKLIPGRAVAPGASLRLR